MLRDDLGHECGDADDARELAVQSVAELVARQIVAGNLVELSHRIDVEDSDGQIVWVLRFGDFFNVPARADA